MKTPPFIDKAGTARGIFKQILYVIFTVEQMKAHQITLEN
jgi:hypothetical protein